jgi:hypothetical protein
MEVLSRALGQLRCVLIPRNDVFTNQKPIKNTVQFKARREYIHVDSDAASMPHTALNQTVFFISALLVSGSERREFLIPECCPVHKSIFEAPPPEFLPM